MFSVKLPFPPSVNAYYRHVRIGVCNRVLISAKGREYSQAVAVIVKPMIAVGPYPILRDIGITINVTPPDRRVHDIDNLLKGLLDSLTKAGLWKDDSQLSRILIQRMPVDPHNGSVHITVEAA